MSPPSIEFWWTLILGTFALLFLAIIIVISVIASKRKLVSMQQEKYEALKESDIVVQESEKKYRTLVESMQEAVFVLDPEGKLLFVNSRFYELLKIEKETVIGELFSEAIKGKSARSILNYISRVYSTGKTENAVHKITIKNRSCWLETTFVPQYDDQGDIVSVMGISRDTTVRKKMEDQLKEFVDTLNKQQQMLKSISAELIKAQEVERERISRELHDEIGQTLTAISINLEMIKQQQGINKSELTRKITDCKKLVQTTMRNVHRFSFDLRPAVLNDLGLLAAIRSHVRGFSERTGIDVNVRGGSSIKKLDNETKTILYRVMQESLNNVSKHAQATLVDVYLGIQKGTIVMQIEDNGVGFDPDKLDKAQPGKGGLGIQGIRERVGIIGGSLSIVSKQNLGTTIKVDIPFGEA